MDKFQLITPLDRPDYQDLVDGLATASWKEFMLHDPVADENWDALFDYFPEYQFALLDTQAGRTAAMANSLPLNWFGNLEDLPEGGWDWAFVQAVADHRAGLEARTQCAIQIAIHPDYQGQGLSARMVENMRAIGQHKGFKNLVAPVRPSMKHLYPLASIDRYITWKTADGLPFDAWLRVHARAGARIVKPCHEAMHISGTIAEWEEWTGMKFPESGEYIVPGALLPVLFDLEADKGTYIEPNVWTVHSLI